LAPRYAFDSFPKPTGAVSFQPYGISQSGFTLGQTTFFFSQVGIVVGVARDADGSLHGMLYQPGLDISGFDSFWAFDDPSAGQGSGQFTDPRAISSSGHIVGDYVNSDGVVVPFIFTNTSYNIVSIDGVLSSHLGGTFTSLPALRATTFVPNGINSHDEIVGVGVDADGSRHGMIYQNGTYTRLDLGQGANAFTSLEGINDSGDIVGEYSASDGTVVPFLYHGGTFNALPLPTGAMSFQPGGVNNAGVIYGLATNADNSVHTVAYVGNTYVPLDAAQWEYFGEGAATLPNYNYNNGVSVMHITATYATTSTATTASVFVYAGAILHNPVIVASDITAAHQASIAASGLFHVSSIYVITQYQFWDSTFDDSSGHFVINGVAQGGGHAIDVNPTQLMYASFQTGSGSDDLWVRAFDGTVWSGWQEFHVNAPVDHTPVAAAPGYVASRGEAIALSHLFSVIDGDSDTITKYQFWDSTHEATSGHFVVDGVAQDAGHAIDVSLAQLSNATFQSGSGPDDLWVRAFDGIMWGGWQEFHVNAPVDNVTIVSAPDRSAAPNQSIAVSNLFSIQDADRDVMTRYQFWDSSFESTSGHFVVGGAAQGVGHAIDVTAAQFASTTFQTGTTSDDLWVRAFDGTQWSAWQEFHVKV